MVVPQLDSPRITAAVIGDLDSIPPSHKVIATGPFINYTLTVLIYGAREADAF